MKRRNFLQACSVLFGGLFLARKAYAVPQPLPEIVSMRGEKSFACRGDGSIILIQRGEVLLKKPLKAADWPLIESLYKGRVSFELLPNSRLIERNFNISESATRLEFSHIQQVGTFR